MTLVGFYGDDFTGSVDALLQYRRAGLDGVLVTAPEFVPTTGATDQVVGIAGIARSLPTDRLPDEVLPALTALARLQPRLVQYKACSTADSSPEVGSLGRAIELGRQVYGGHPVGVLFAQPGFGRYTAFGNHFARDGERVHRLDRHPTMREHPVTPAREADLTRLLGEQTRLRVASLAFIDFLDGAEAAALSACGADVVVLDGLTDEHLRWAGRALLGQPQPVVFALGSGGLSRGVGLALTGAGRELSGTVEPGDGPVLAVSGSRSARTWAQVGDAVGRGWQPVDVLGEQDAATAAARAFAAGRSVVAYSSAPGGPVEPDGEVVAARLAEVVTAVAARAPLSRLVVAGGDTCGRVLTWLGVQRIEVLATPWDNAAFCRVTAPGEQIDGVEIVLKGGQMGTVDLFERVRTGTPLADVLPTN